MHGYERGKGGREGMYLGSYSSDIALRSAEAQRGREGVRAIWVVTWQPGVRSRGGDMQAKQRQSMPLVKDKDNNYFRVRAYEAQVPNPRSLKPTPLLYRSTAVPAISEPRRVQVTHQYTNQ